VCCLICHGDANQNPDENAAPHPIEDPHQNCFTHETAATDPDHYQNAYSHQDRHTHPNKHGIAHTNPECDGDSKWRNTR
jgi:hypothetical protein